MGLVALACFAIVGCGSNGDDAGGSAPPPSKVKAMSNPEGAAPKAPAANQLPKAPN